MDVLAFKEAFDAFLFKGCLFALAGLSVVFFMLTCGFRREIEDFIKKTGPFFVVFFFTWAAWAFISSFPTQEEKEEILKAEKEQEEINKAWGAFFAGGMASDRVGEVFGRVERVDRVECGGEGEGGEGGMVIGDSCSGRKEGENSTLQLPLKTTTITPTLLQSSSVSSGLFRTTGFEVDSVNRSLGFEVAWDDDLFDYTLPRNIFLYVSTNLVLKRWSLFDVYPMPEGTNAHTFAVSLSNYDWAASAFFQFGLDIDSDNDGLIDSYERLCTLTDSANSDSDRDGISDGQEIVLGLDPLAPIDPFLDLDGDGLTHDQELACGSNPLMVDSDGDGLDDATELRNGWNPNWPGETNEANAPGGAFTTFDRPFTANVRFENPYQEATVYGVSEGSHTVVLSDMVTRDAHKDIASTVSNNIITVTTLDPKPIFTTNVTGVLIVKLKCDDYGVIRIGDLAVTNSWPNTEFVKAWKVIEANTTNEVDITWDSKGGSKWNFEYECYFYPEKALIYKIDLDIDSDNDGLIEDLLANDEDAIEDVKGRPGKALYLNELDRDYDGIPDYADGYDIDFGEGSQSAPNASRHFAKMRLSIQGAIVQGYVKFICSEVDDNAIVARSGDGTIANKFIYFKPNRKIRIWKKDGIEARSMSEFPIGDLIHVDTLYDVAQLLDSSSIGEFYIEAIGGSENLGDIEVIAEFFPFGRESEKVEDKVKMTVFSIEAVHPLGEDFSVGAIGKIMISTKQDIDGSNRYYTTNLTTASERPAQTEDGKITLSAYIKPVPNEPIPNLMAKFELVDPDDLSHYEGKAIAGTPSIQGDIMPNDNNDPNCRMSYLDRDLCGYYAFQSRLSSRSVTPLLSASQSKTNYIAETVLSFTSRYSGDNYRVRATLADNSSQPFDTLSNIDFNAKSYVSSVKESAAMIAWKRFYIEQDEMYKKGCTLIRDFVYDPASTQQVLYVDSTNDFYTTNMNVIVFWKEGEARNITLKSCGAGSIIVSGLTNSVPKFAGVRIAGENETYTVDRRFLDNAYGLAADGSDGGAFMEFNLLHGLKNVNDKIPKWSVFTNTADWMGYIDYWFDNKVNYQKNVIYLLVARKFDYGGLLPYGMAFRRKSMVAIFNEVSTGENQLNDTLAHEIGHRQGLKKGVGGVFGHIDAVSNQFTHCGSDSCLMSYARDRNDGIVEFCTNCLQTAFSSIEGLRRGKDQ